MKRIVGFLVIVGLYFCNCEQDVDNKCIINDEEPWDAPGNYMDCDSEENQQSGNTNCCKQDGAVGCCNKDDQFKDMKAIAIGVGVGTFCLCVLVFLLVYCNPKTFPCLDTCRKRINTKYERFEEGCCCCRGRVERRRKARLAEEMPQYEGADEMKVTVQDDFWNMNAGSYQ